MTTVESQLERELSTTIIRGGAKPEIRKVPDGRTLVEQGDPGDEVYLLLNGVLSVEVDTARRWPSSGPAPSSASAPSWKAVSAPRRCGRSPSARWP